MRLMKWVLGILLGMCLCGALIAQDAPRQSNQQRGRGAQAQPSPNKAPLGTMERARQDVEEQRARDGRGQPARGAAAGRRQPSTAEQAYTWFVIIGYNVLFFGVVAAVIVWWVRRKKTPPQSTVHGSAAWSPPGDDLKQALKPSQPLPPGAVFLAPQSKANPNHYLAVPRPIALRHGIILGGSGTGKSRGYFLPTLAWSEGTSFIATDIKSELWDNTSGAHKTAYRFAPLDPDASVCFNFLALCKDPRIAELVADAIVSNKESKGDPFWAESEAMVITALVSHVAHTATPTPAAAYDLFTLTDFDDLLDIFRQSPSVVARRQAVLFALSKDGKSSTAREGIRTGVVRSLKWLEDPRIRRFTSASKTPPNFASLRSTPQALYWCMPELDMTRLRKLTSIFFTLVLEQLGRAEGDVPVTMMLDEFGNMGVIPDFPRIITLARGRGISFWLGLQELSQLDESYKREGRRTILGSCATKIILSGADLEIAEYVSRSLGTTTIMQSNTSVTKTKHGKSSTTSPHLHGRSLMTPDEVRQIDENTAIVIMSNRPPLHTLKMWFDSKPLKALCGSLGEEITIPEPDEVTRISIKTAKRAAAQPPQMPEFEM